MAWVKVNRYETAEGTTIVYRHSREPWLSIESRKRHIPHAGGRPGTWDHTTYWVVINNVDEKECYSLADAKKYVEDLYGTEA